MSSDRRPTNRPRSEARDRGKRTARTEAEPTIDEHGRGEKAAGESEELFRLLVEGVEDYAIFMVDPHGHVVSWNPGAQRIKGYPAEEIIGQHFSRFYTGEDIERGKPARELQVAAKEGRFEDEGWRVRADGSRFWASVVITALRDEAGDLRGFSKVTRDITQRKRMEDAVEHERRRFETLVDSSPVGIFVADADGRVLLVNREAERILGFPSKTDDRLERYEQAVVYRRPDGSAYAPEELPLQRALDQREIVRAEEILFEFADGRTVLTLVNATPIFRPEGKVTGAIAVIQDITPLEEVEKLRSEFLGMVSHELRTPLTAIKGSAAIALGTREPLDAAQARELFQIIDEQADRLRDMVDNLLEMTRIEAGALSISPEPTDLGAVVEEVQATFLRGGGPQDLELVLPQGLPAVQADRRRIVQVLSNLLSNASKVSPPMAPITIEADYDEVQVTVRVRDRGRGIPKEKLPHLFKKFSRIHEDAGPELPGTGLGLAISKGIVEAHGGRLWAESLGEGQGATFSFTLPAAEARITPLTDIARRAAHLRKVSRARERTRILAVDDEPQTLRYLRRCLEDAGYQAIVSSDPSRVVALVETEEPDLILLDLMLPGTDGFDLLQRIREFSGVPVVFLTASEKEEDTVRALKMGADDYITKPFSPSELLARIEAVLRRRLAPDLIEAHEPYGLGDLTINFAERVVTVEGRTVSLSATEYKLLYELATHAGRVLTHDQILQRVWGPAYSGETGLLRSFIRNLRRKLGDDARHPKYILTEPQVGYRMPKPQS